MASLNTQIALFAGHDMPADFSAVEWIGTVGEFRAANECMDGDDLQALVNFDEHQSKFLRFSKAAGYTVVDATKRHAARLEIIEAFVEQLEAHAKAHKPS